MTAQTIKTPAGEELVVLPRAEYDALLDRLAELEEDVADVAAYDAAKAAMGDELGRAIEPDEMKGVLIRAQRKRAGLTQTELAKMIGVAQGFVSDLESGRRRGSVETIDSIGAALGMDAETLAALRG